MEEEKDWLVQINVPGLPGVWIMRACNFDELPEMIRRVRELLPEVKVTPHSVNTTLRKLSDPGETQ